MGYYRLYTDLKLLYLELFFEEKDGDINIYFGYI
jgi:hypothetical protein